MSERMTSHHQDYQIDKNQIQTEPRKKWTFGTIFDAVMIALLVGAAGWIGWFGLKATRSVSRSLAGPDTVVRLQIVNATSDSRLGAAVATELSRYIDREISFAVVDTARFGSRKVRESFLVAREDNLKTAEMVAARLGLGPEKVTVLPLEHNTRNVAITLVLGDDYRTLAPASLNNKETKGKS